MCSLSVKKLTYIAISPSTICKEGHKIPWVAPRELLGGPMASQPRLLDQRREILRLKYHIIPGHGEVITRDHLGFFRGFLTDLIAAVKKAAADGASLEEMQKGIADQLASKYEQGMSKYPLGRYRDRVGPSVEIVYKKVVKKA
jgi:hypothetical protein